MPRLFSFRSVVVLLIALGFNACIPFLNCEEGKGEIRTERYAFPDIRDVELELGSSSVTITQQEGEPYIEVSTYENLFELIRAEGKAGNVKVGSRKCLDVDRDIEVRLFVRTLEELHIEGSSDVMSAGPLNLENFELHISGSGDANLDINAQEIECKVNGSGDVILQGSTRKLLIGINGSGDVDTQDLEARGATVKINGSGDVFVTAREELSAVINGSGDIRYRGNPTSVHSKILGSGSVHRE